MSAILAFLTACVLIVWGMFRKTKKKEEMQPVFVRRYVHPGHTWMKMTEDGDVLVGVDEFAQSLIGTIDSVELPRLLRRVEQGSVAWSVRHGDRVVRMVSPVSGRVIEKNEMVLNNPLLVNSSPYNDGWLLRIRPMKLQTQINNLFTGKAMQQWLEQAKEQLVRIFSTTPALMYQDGGVIVKDLADKVSDEEWNTLEREFFLTGDQSDDNLHSKKSVPQW
ncbi:glycine cleavage system protein H [Sphingobacteriales bacterium CHB3]|nr:glycine cleavage system protein H [Sphingobacteriales bacterium CHB3]